MTGTAQQIAAILARKQTIETDNETGRFGCRRQARIWLVDAIDLLLRIELERQGGAKP